MTTALTYVISVLLFLLVFRHVGIVQVCKSALVMMREVVRVIADKGMDDGDKETAIRKTGLRMVRISLSLLIRSLLLLLAVVIPVWLSDVAGLSSFSQTASFALRMDVLVLTLIAVYLSLMLFRKAGIRRRTGSG